ncbi:MAG: hypothetical protein BRC29_00025 [Nanohaloarchaea archaeon SW_7_43_1]|nr:MAG: hypothetical protein BRC29_00025 [Nanohaloarchaea archaeon SW_7_43_1]
MSIFESIKEMVSDSQEEGDSRDLSFEMDDESLDFTLSDKQDIKITGKIEKMADVDVKYALIKPFAYAHVKWNEEQKEVIYRIIEPELDDESEELLEIVKDNLSEKIDVSLSSMGGREKIIGYLQDQINDLLIELGISMTDEQHKKILYYIYRDFVGLGKVEPFMHDPYIEDVGCDGTGTPIFAVHSEFGSVKSGVHYNDQEDLENLVIKLAERAGRYVSYANPLLDGALPDGSRVNASLTEDVTAHGPTFSIRKFQETPFSAVDMMDLGTANAEIMAYIWILQQYQQSILICGGTSTGKTSYLNATVSFIPPEDKIVSIEDSITGDTEIELVENGTKVRKPISEIVDPLIEKRGEKLVDGAEKAELSSEIRTATIDENLKTSYQQPSAFYRHKVDKDIYRVKTASGRELKITEDHSIFGLDNSDLKEIKPQESEGERIAVPRELPTGHGVNSLNIIQNAENKERLFAEGKAIEELYNQASWTKINEVSDISNSGFKYWKRNQMMRGKEIHNLTGQDIKIDEDYIVRSKSKSIEFQPELDITSELLEIFGLWLGDGSYDRHNDNCVLITTSEQEIEDVIRKGIGQLDINITKKSDGTLSINSVVLLELMKGIGFKGKSKTKTVPEFCINLNERQIGAVLKGYFSADGSVKNHEVTCSSQSRELLEGIQDLLLRLGIVGSINDYDREDDCKELSISSQKFLRKYEEKAGFVQKRKNDSLKQMLERDKAHHEKNDVIPTSEEFAERIHRETKIQWNYRNNANNLGRNYLKELTEDEEILKLANSDIYWDKVIEVEKIDQEETYVYDISVPESERFIANNILAHNTRELQLPHENWIPSVTREMFGTSSQGDVDMDQLLKESFRQNPDYVVVGEVRGEEASVLFQGMSSLPGSERVLVKENGKLKKKPIEEIGKPQTVPSIDPETGEVELKNGSAKIEHPEREELLKIKTSSGKTVKVTKDHSVFGWEKGKCEALQAGELEEGDRIVTPAKLPCGFNDKDNLNLLELLDNPRVRAPQYFRRSVEKLSYREAGDVTNVQTITDYYGNHQESKPSSMELDKFQKLMDEAKIDYNPKELELKYLRKSGSLPALLPLTDEFLRLIGYYISEGSINKGNIQLYASDEKVIEDMKKCFESLGENPAIRESNTGYGESKEVQVANLTLAKTLKQLCGHGSSEKKIPGFIYGLSKQRIGEVLTGLWNGDGSFTENKFSYFTISKELAEDVTHLLQCLEIFSLKRNRNRDGRDTTDYEIHLGRKNDQERMLKYIETLKAKVELDYDGRDNKYRHGEIVADKIKHIEKIELEEPEPVYDISVPGNESFIGGSGGIMLHNSGHPSMGTMHASSPNAVVKRLTTPPISLSPALIEAIDVMVVMTHAKGVENSARRVKNIHELQKVVGESASARTNQAFSWTAVDDSFSRRGEPYLFDQISKDYGVAKQKLMKEMDRRTNLLKWLQEKGVSDFDEVSDIVAEYYKNKDQILKMINSEDEKYTLQDVIDAEEKVDLSRPDQLDNAVEDDEGETLEKEINDIDSDADVETKKKIESNPVADLEKKLKSEREKIEKVRSRTPEERHENPFSDSKNAEEDPFEA